MQEQRLLFCLLLSFLLITRGLFFLAEGDNLDNLQLCVQNRQCKSKCCRRGEDGCESHCSERGSEGSKCHTQTFLGLYEECPCRSNLICVFPKNQKSFKVIFGTCQKGDLKKLPKNPFF